MPLMAVSFLASCNQKTYCTVSFDTTGGSSVPSQTIEKGKTATKPTDPTKKDYCFQEWLLDDERFDFNTPINQDITLTAIWDYNDSCPYLTFSAEEDSSLKYTIAGGVTTEFYYSNDMEEWTGWNENENIEIKKGNKIYVKNDEDSLSTDNDWYVQFEMTGKIAASGDISSLINKQENKDVVSNYEYINLFKDCDALVRAPKLPAKQIGLRSYDSMFANCHNLIKAPDLPADQIDNWSYYFMFQNCTNLIKAPDLPALELGVGSYSNMFEGCKKLEKAPIMSATQLADHCCEQMFKGCKKLEKAPTLLSQTTATSCYHEMFYDCDALVEGPMLLATELSNWCYAGMFFGCQNLVAAPYLPASVLKDYCYFSMFFNCPNLEINNRGIGTKFFDCPDTTPEKCVANMFSGTAGTYTSDPVVASSYYYE